MVLVDTNIWIHHFKKTDAELVANLNMGLVACHPFIIGELACGNLKKRAEIIGLFEALPTAPVLDPEEVLTFIETKNLMGKGLGYVDVHLLASATLAGITLWTEDTRLKGAAKSLKLSYKRQY